MRAVPARLRAFRSDDTDNPGRANAFSIGDATVVVDYAHNAHGLRALAEAAGHWPATRRLVLFGSAGDRSDADIADMADVLAGLDADRYVLVDIPGYLRGRAEGEVPALLRRLLVERGVTEAACDLRADPLTGTHHVLDHLGAGDLGLLIVLAQRDAVLEVVRTAAL